MDVIYVGQEIDINWSIRRNASEVLEDFSKADLKVFLTGNDFDGNYDGKYYFANIIDDQGRVKLVIEAGNLTPGTYCIEGIWIKNSHELLNSGWTRSISRARKDRIFKVSDVEEECTDYDEDEGHVVEASHEINIATGTTSYGYDGMSAYETAVFNGSTAKTEKEWIDTYEKAEDRVNYEMDPDNDGQEHGDHESWAHKVDVKWKEQIDDWGERAQADHERAGEDSQQAATDHNRADTDHTRANEDSGRASNDHTQAVSDSSRAAQDHTQAATDHNRADTDHTRANEDSGRAGEDHTQAVSDSEQAAADHAARQEDVAAANQAAANADAARAALVGSTGAVNVNLVTEQKEAYIDAATARGAVPAAVKQPGLKITYLLAAGWYSDQFIGDDIDDWSDASKWQVTGPISVSQNTETGHTEINIGGTAYPVASADEVNQLKSMINIVKLDFGSIDASTGEDTAPMTTRVRTVGHIKTPFKLKVADGYKIQEIARYTLSPDGSFEFVDVIGTRLPQYYLATDNYYYRFTFSKDDSSEDILESELSEIIESFDSSVRMYDDIKALLNLAGKKISVCGDSNWCFEGVSTGQSSRYYPGSPIVDSADNTFWGMFIKKAGSILERNVSVGSSGVTDNMYYGQQPFYTRVSDMGTPDVVLLGGGLNEPPIGDGDGELVIGNFHPDVAIGDLNRMEFCDAYDYLIRTINQTLNNPQIIIFIHPYTDYRIISAMMGIGAYYGAFVVSTQIYRDYFEMLEETGISPIHYTQNDMTLCFDILNQSLSQNLDDVVIGTFNHKSVVKELYVENLDTTHQYHIRQLYYNPEYQVYRLQICDETETVVVNTTLSYKPTDVVEFTFGDGKAYILLDIDESDIIQHQYLINNAIAGNLNFAPGITNYIQNKSSLDVAKKGSITFTKERIIVRNSGLIYIATGLENLGVSDFLLIDKGSDIEIRNGWNNPTDNIAPLAFYDKDMICVGVINNIEGVGRKSFTIEKSNVPSTAKYIRICTNTSVTLGDADVIKGVTLYAIAERKDDDYTIVPIEKREYSLYGKEILKYFQVVNSASGYIQESATKTAKSTDFIDISNAESIETTLFYNVIAANNNGLAFFDKNKNYISGAVNHDYAPYQKITIARPTNAKYVKICCITENYAYYPVALNPIPFFLKVNYRYVEKRGYVNGEFSVQGDVSNPSSTTWSNTGHIPVYVGEVIEYETCVLNNSSLFIYDENDELIKVGFFAQVTASSIIKEIAVVPEGASYAVVQTLNPNHGLYKAGFLPTCKVYRSSYGLEENSNDSVIASLNLGAKCMARTDKAKDLVFNDTFNFEPTRISDYEPEVVASISSDDAIEGYLVPISSPVISEGGFFSRMYPICETAGKIPSSEAVEYQRIVGNGGGASTDGDINDAGKVLRALCATKNWEAMNHTLTAKFSTAYVFDTWNDAMAAVTAHTINPVGNGYYNNSTTQIYIKDRNTNYYYTKPAGTYSTLTSDWVETPYQYIKPKLINTSGVYVSLNPTYPYDYQINVAQRKISALLETPVDTFIAPSDSNSYKMREFALLTHKQAPTGILGTNDFVLAHGVVRTPLESCPARIGDWDLAEDNHDNTGDNTLFNTWKTRFDALCKRGTKAFILAMHIYRWCWVNRIADDADVPTAAKVDIVSGGTYPESWIIPVRKPTDFPDDFLPPHPDTGLDRWGSFEMQSDGSIRDADGTTVMDANGDFVQYSTTCWMPCYGTRLFQLWRFLLYIKSKGIDFMSIKDNLSRLYNRVSVGFYPYWYNNNSIKVADEPVDVSYYFVGADGSKVYHKV